MDTRSHVPIGFMKRIIWPDLLFEPFRTVFSGPINVSRFNVFHFSRFIRTVLVFRELLMCERQFYMDRMLHLVSSGYSSWQFVPFYKLLVLLLDWNITTPAFFSEFIFDGKRGFVKFRFIVDLVLDRYKYLIFFIFLTDYEFHFHKYNMYTSKLYFKSYISLGDHSR